ncbi:uncharacterized protein BDV17DRAFT_262040 [Aspergillus undulatus]|uniref:uncharacterized protein n=1 Tax=Aspergillus undulatus TaxID=1810928 RepID=UPI003CCD5D38
MLLGLRSLYAWASNIPIMSFGIWSSFPIFLPDAWLFEVPGVSILLTCYELYPMEGVPCVAING